ncbi:hypothetical protein K432DRAFT_444897, partial [Lepidopterella palustris CBS 459.81]
MVAQPLLKVGSVVRYSAGLIIGRVVFIYNALAIQEHLRTILRNSTLKAIVRKLHHLYYIRELEKSQVLRKRQRGFSAKTFKATVSNKTITISSNKDNSKE